MSKIKDRDNPEWTRDMFRKARPARQVFPHIDFPKPKGRGPQKTATKVQTTIRLDRDVVEHFKALGRGWQSRINATLRGAVKQRRRKRA
jgi:uncharacterized protein (DUF4415 family)